MFISYRKNKKRQIDDRLLKILAGQKPFLAKASSWGPEAIAKLERFTVAGKTIRGSLVFLGAEMFGYAENDVLLPLACAIELIHSAFLIHDDIMDNDLTRRDQATIYAGYLSSGPVDLAKSMGICVGDLSLFLGIYCVGQTKTASRLQTIILQKLMTEISIVAVAQMADVYFGTSKHEPTLADINKLYLYKTARYTFSLPLALGAIAAGQPPKIIHQVEKLGESIGTIFQIKDDEFDLTADIRENKKTLIRKLNNPTLVKKKIAQLSFQAKTRIASLPVNNEYKNLLLDMADFMERREK